jgi:hypothetical protein
MCRSPFNCYDDDYVASHYDQEWKDCPKKHLGQRSKKFYFHVVRDFNDEYFGS